MSFLHPFFLLAALAVAVPVVLHLARRRTRQEQPWSSLLFLQAHPPRLERRRRIEHWLLLALRMTAFILLALAFARPFISRPLPALAAATGRRVLLLVDTSASMRREGLWAEALARLRAEAGKVGAGDRLAVLAFDERVQWVVSFEAWASATPGERPALLEQRLAALAPSYRATDLGAALVAAGDALLDDQSAAPTVPVAASTVLLVSDVQEGSRLAELSAADWPAGVTLRVQAVEAARQINVGLQALPPAVLTGEEAANARVRVRVTASKEAAGGSVKAVVRWRDEARAATELVLSAGETRAVEAPARAAGPGTLVVTGDGAGFDNELHLAPPVATPARILYVGGDATRAGNEPGPLFFLQKAFPATRSRAPQVQAFAPADAALGPALSGADLLVATAAPAASNRPAIESYLAQGRVLLLAPGTAEAGAAMGELLLGKNLGFREAAAGREAVLTEVDLGHPLLAPFAEGAASDFTKLRFWKRRLLDLDQLPGARVLGRFDDGAPALISAPSGKGQLVLLTSGWDLADSQLALSSKLVPLLWTLLETSAGLASDRSQFFVGERIPLPAPGTASGNRSRRLLGPDGQQIPLAETAVALDSAEEPGIYTLVLGQERRPFAVNLRPGESATAPLPLEHLERLGVRLADSTGAASAGASGPVPLAGEQQRRAAFHGELERQQRPWRFLLLAVFLALVLETWLAGRRAREVSGTIAGKTAEASS